MLIMGLPNYIDWLAWFTKFLIESLPITFVFALLLKIPLWSPVACVHHSNGFLLWLLLFCFVISMTSFALMVSTIFKTSRRASLWMTFILIVSLLPLLSVEDTGRVGPFAFTLILTLCGCTFGMAIRLFAVFEEMGVGMQWRYLFASPSGTPFSVGILLIALICSAIFYMLLALYFEKVIPGAYGAPRKWYFPVERFLSKRSSSYTELSEQLTNSHDTLQRNPRVEAPNQEATPGIVIANLSKVFGGNCVAVKELSMNIYENEITVLLGENGAGKSTVMSMLTGILSPTAGTAFIRKEDIRAEMEKIRHEIGLCPQHNVLFNKLTVEEHLLFFGKLKGLRHSEAMQETKTFIVRMGLQGKADTRAEKLSGGMMRKLNLAISLAGGTKVVFLDEPTSGVDPASRREIWNILQEEKKSRTILLSTHFMDEADILGDRVAILHHGELRCFGSSLFLKNFYESSYKLVSSSLL